MSVFQQLAASLAVAEKVSNMLCTCVSEWKTYLANKCINKQYADCFIRIIDCSIRILCE